MHETERHDILVIEISSVDFEGVRKITAELLINDEVNEVRMYVSRNISELIDVFIEKVEQKYKGYYIKVKNNY